MIYKQDIHYSFDLEAAILGACLLEKEAFGRIYGSIEPENFYHTSHQIIFSTLRDMYVNGIPIDLFTLKDQIIRVQGRENITAAFMVNLTLHVVRSTHLEYHCYLVKTMWMQREIIRLTTSGDSKLSGDAGNQISELQEKLRSLQQKTIRHDWKDMTQLMVELYQHQEDIKTGGQGITTGINKIDQENGGFQPGQMVVIGARPSVGKSALVGSIALHSAAIGKNVGIVSLEMSNAEIASRLASIDTDTDFHVLYRGLYQDQYQMQAVYNRIGNITSQLPIFVSDKTGVDIVEIRSKADKLKSLHGLDLLIIDYLQLIDVPELANRNRENEISKVSRYCKIMAKEMNIPVILLCQLNRESTKRHGESRYPQLSDIRESGSIEQDADIVMFLHRDFLSGIEVNEDGSSTERQADLIIRKWRNGKSNFRVAMDFDPPKMKFTERKVNGFRPFEPQEYNNQ